MASEPPADYGDTDMSEVGEVWLGGGHSVEGDEFVEALNAVEDLQDGLEGFRDELRDLSVGLDREDAVNLLWGRTNLNKTQIRATFEVMDAIIEEDPEDIAPRLLADQTSELTIQEAATVWDDLIELADKYGSAMEDDDA